MSNRTAKFGILAVIMVPALVFLASCEIPQSARIKASPTFHIPIPLGDGMDNSFIRSFINVDDIKEKLKDSEELGKAVSIYEYNSETLMTHFDIPLPEGSRPVQTYLITYPIFDLDLNFDQYLNGTLLDTDASRVPPLDIDIEISNQVAAAIDQAIKMNIFGQNGLPYYNWIDPFMGNPPEVNLGDMNSLISDIAFKSEGVSFSIIVDPQNAETLQKAIRIRIPLLKIGYVGNNEFSWAQGTLNNEKTKLVFRSRPNEINQDIPLLLTDNGNEDDEKIKIEVRLINKIGVGKYGTELDFNWHSAKVHPRTTDAIRFNGFDLNSYLSALGSNVEFSAVPAYIYIITPGKITGFGVTIEGADVTQGSGFQLKRDDIIKEIKEGVEQPLPDWLADKDQNYDFTGASNSGSKSSNIKYKVEMPNTITINKDDDNTGKITVNLAVLLPMVFSFNNTSETITINDGNNSPVNYLPISFGGLEKFLEGSGNGGGGKSVMEQIEEQLGEGSGISNIELRLRDIRNNVTSPIFLAIAKTPGNVEPGPNDWNLVEIVSGKPDPEPFSFNDISLAQLPRIKFLLKETAPGEDGILYIQSVDSTEEKKPDFSVKISVVADINLNKTIP